MGWVIESIDINPDGVVVNYTKFEGWREGIITKGGNTQQLNMHKQNKA